MAGSEKNSAELIASITGCDVLAGWHILVAYRADEINGILATLHAEIDKVTPVSEVKQFCHPVDDPVRPGHSINYYYNLKLGSPTITFQNSKCSVQLRYPLTGSVGTTTDKQEQTIPGGLFLTCAANLKNVRGTFGTNTDQPSSILDSNAIFTFAADQAEMPHITIDLRKPRVTVTNESGQIHEAFDGILRSNLTEHISCVGLRYRLIAVSCPKSDETKGQSQIIPSSFCLTTVSSNTPERSSLLMWISVKDLPFSGRPDTTAKELIFSPNDKDPLNPIPTDKSAGIYFSRDFVYLRFIKPSLENVKFSVINLQNSGLGVKADEIRVTCTPSDTQVNVPEWLLDGSANSGRIRDAFSFNMNTATLDVVLNKTQPVIDFRAQVSNVVFRRVGYGGTFGAVYRQDSTGEANLTLSKQSNGYWVKGSDDGEGKLSNKIELHFDSIGKLDVNAVNAGDHNLAERIFLGKLSEVLDGMNDDKVDIPSPLTLNLSSIDYSLATSLFFPSSVSFRAGEIPNDLFVPHGLVIFGSIRQ